MIGREILLEVDSKFIMDERNTQGLEDCVANYQRALLLLLDLPEQGIGSDLSRS